jgi:hypothetical protein
MLNRRRDGPGKARAGVVQSSSAQSNGSLLIALQTAEQSTNTLE